MTVSINIEALRRDLKDYFGTGAMTVSPAMMSQVWAIDRMTPEQLIRLAQANGFDLRCYQV